MTAEEAENSINALELQAGFFALKTYASTMKSLHVRLMMDNTTAVACVNKMGTSHSPICNNITQNIWKFCQERDIWLSAAYIPGKENTAADRQSRTVNTDTEWKMNSELFLNGLRLLGTLPEIDL